LIIGVAAIAIAIPIAARVSPAQAEFVEPLQVNPYQQTAAYTEVAKAAHIRKTGVGHRAAPPQDYYDRRRAYWENRIERRADYLEQEDGDDEDAADSEDSQDANAEDDEEDSIDSEEELIERRREYWRDRLDRDW
jgi:hypothetical protein